MPGCLRRSFFLQHVARLWSLHFGADQLRVSRDDLERAFKKERQLLPAGPGDPRRDRGAFNAEVLKGFVAWGHAWLDEPWQKLRPLFGEFQRQARAHHFTPLVVCFPVRIQVEAEFLEDYPQRMLKEICAPLDLPVLDMLPVLRDASRESQEPLFFDACHHTARGNEVIARHILEFLRAH
jgi:hypothetical protein